MGAASKQAQGELRAAFLSYLRNRQELEAARKTVEDLQLKIADCEVEERQAIEGIPTSEAVAQQAEDLAAAVALGQAAPAEAAKRRAGLEKQEAALAKSLAAARAAKQTRAGLDRVLQKTRATIQELETKGRDLLCEALRERAKACWSAYVEHGRATREAFLTLAALDGLLVTAGGYKAGIVNRYALQQFCIVAFRLPGYEELTHVGDRDHLFSESGWPLHNLLQRAVAEQQAQLREIGVDL
jgi:hypothetical protein